MVLKGDVIHGTRQAPRVYYVLEKAKVGWKGMVPARSFLGEVERSVEGGGF
jgi:hypothetical protein